MANKKIKGITIQIGADTTGLDTALNGIEKKSKGTKSELAEVSRALKKAPESAELWKQKQELLAKAIQDSRDKVKLLEDAQEQVNQQFKDSKIGEEQYRAFKRELEYAKAEVGRFEGELESLNKTADSASEDVKNLGNSAEDAGEKAEKSGDGFTVLKGALAHLVYEGIEKAVGAFKDFAEEAMVFNDSIAKVSTIADATVPITELQDSIVELSNQTGISSSEIAENVYNAISAGQETADSVNFVENATKLARAGFAETGNALDILSTIMNAYGMEASEVTRVSDVLIQTQNLGKTTVAELSSAMGKVIPTANAYGVSLEQLAAGYAIMTANGVATAESTTYMNSMLNELGKSGTGVSNILKEETGKSFKELSDSGMSLSEVLSIIDEAAQGQNKAFSDMWSSSEAGKAGLILLGDSAENFNQTLGKMQSASGATETAFSKLNTESFELQKAQNQLKNASIELGKEVLKDLTPIAEKILPKIENGVDWITDNLPEIKEEAKKLIPYVTGLSSGFAAFKISGPIIKGVSNLFTSLKSGTSILKTFNSVLSLTPTTAAIAGITALAGAVVTLALSYKEPQTEIEKAIDKQKEYNQKIQDETTALKGAKTAAEESAGAEQLKYDKAQALWKELDKLADSQGKVSEKDQARAEFITNELENLTGIEIAMIDGQIQKYDELKKSIEDVIKQKKAEAVMSAFNATYEESITQQVDAQKGYREAKSEIEKYQNSRDRFEKEARLRGYNGDFSVNSLTEYIGDTSDSIFTQEEVTAYIESGTAINALEATMQLEEERYKQADENIQKMEKAQEAYYEGNYDEAIAFLREERQINFDSEKFQRQSNQAKLNDYKAMLSDMQSNYELALEANNEKDMAAWQSKIDDLLIRAKQDGIDIGDKLGEGYQERFNKIIDSNTEALYNTNNLVMENINSAWDVAIKEARGYAAELAEWTQKIYRENNLIQEDSVNSPWDAELKINGKYATGGYISSGNTAVVAESGPELLEIMNGGVRVTPLTGAVRNTEVDSGTTNKTVNIFNTIKVDKISSDYDVSRLSEQLSFEERRAEIGKGQ